MAYLVAVLAVVVALIFWWTQKQTRAQNEWRAQKELEIAKKRALIAAKKKAEATPPPSEEE